MSRMSIGAKLYRFLMVSIIALSVPLTTYALQQTISFFGKAAGEPANLIIDVGPSFTTTDTWRYYAQGGEERGGMIAPAVKKIKELQPSYIRIDHIYDFYDVLSRGPSGELVFNWQKLDQEVGDITLTGAKPFLSISYMPKELTRGTEVDLPRDWNEWERLVTATVEHYSGLQGLNIEDVYYEVWNEPDLFGQFKTYGDKNYLELYLHTARAAERAKTTKPFKLGGPASTAWYDNWASGLLNFASREKLKVDFISWHRYSKDLLAYETDILKAKRLLLEDFPNYKNIELIITEMGPNSEIDPVYDGTLGAIHALSLAAVLEQENVKGFTFELKDGLGPTKLWGRWGLLTHQKFGDTTPKPRYDAFMFMNRMEGEKLNVAGNGSWVKSFARKKGSVIRVLVANYDPASKHTEAVPMNFINLPSREFTFIRRDFKGDQRQLPVTISDNKWYRVELMKPNSAAIFELVFK